MVTWLDASAGLLGIGGAVLLAVKLRWSWLAWPCWTVSNVLWIAHSLRVSEHALLAQQVVFLFTSLLGWWRWRKE